MKRSVLSSLGFLGLVLALGAPAETPRPSPTPNGPRISVEPTSFEFGPALQNKTLHKEFSLRNFGNVDLVIENVSTTCGCTASELETRTVKPGKSVALRVSLETRAYTGRLQRSVLIKSNDPQKGLLEIKIAAEVQAPAK